MNPEFRQLENDMRNPGQRAAAFWEHLTNVAEVAEHKASRGTSYRAQVIETLWMMLFFCVSFAAGFLFGVRYR